MVSVCRRAVIIPVVVLAACGADAAAIGPIRPRPVTTLYLMADASAPRIRVAIEAEADAAPPRVMLRAYDPDDRLTLWRYVEYAGAQTVASIEAPEGVTLRAREEWDAEPATVLEEELELAAPGVHQVRVVGWTRGLQVRVELPDSVGWGWCAQNGDFLAWEGMPQALFAWVPPHAEQLRLQGGPLATRDDAGAALAELPEPGEATIRVDRTEQLWRFELPEGASFSAADFPLILCPTPEAARAIRGSVEVLDDGTVVCHPFQRRIAELLPEVLAPERVGDTDGIVTPLASRRDAWLADPMRSAILMRSFLPAVEQWLRSQNLDADSHWGGSLAGWEERIDQPPPGNRWDRLRGVEGLYAGASSNYGSAARDLALGALHEAATNPYAGREELLWRAAAAALRDLMVVAEDETWPGTADLDPYPGMMAFALGGKTLPVYGLVAPHMPQRIREVWTEAVRRLIDRAYPDGLVTCRNQSSHYLVAFQAFADGSGDPLYQTLARLYARRWVSGQDPSGYHMEAIGPDASYIGMTHWHEAVYYEMSRDPVVLDSVRRSYSLFNHTVGPEPDGRMLGGFNFNHRVGEGFYFEQWSGAKGILHDDLPEVGMWSDPPPTDEQIEEARRRVAAFLDDPQPPPYPKQTSWRYLAFAEPDRSGVFPCREAEPFWRVIDDQWLFVKRPGYYTYCYLGKPAGEFYIRTRASLREPYPDDGESTGAEYRSVKSITPFVGGGLSGVWTPDYGHSLMAANWAPTTHHGLIATDAEGLRWWEDYHAHEHSLDADAGEVTFTGCIEEQPLTYERRYVFGDDAIEVEVSVTADEDVRLAGLVECVPLARGGWKARGATISAREATGGPARAASFRVTDEMGAGVEFVLEDERDLLLVPDGLQTSGWRQLQIGRVEISLPSELAAGQSTSLRYVVRPIAAG
ncbi:MAG: hypothetical protein U9R79_15835 [Armatimonadota bacterium]|nr:hypothetical protein [Armatimonadota bacterium]